MSIAEEFLDQFDYIAGEIKIPFIEKIHLPPPNGSKRDEFGFVFLSDGSVGPFYTALPNVIDELWQHYPDGKKCDPDTLKLIQYFVSDSLALRSVALGAINALSQHVMKRGGYNPVEQKSGVKTDITNHDKKVCMVGCFDPLIKKFQQQNIEVMVLEKDPSRVDDHDGVTLSSEPKDLSQCSQILCTASTLINGTLEELLLTRNKTADFALIGPSGSCLPDILFKYGVNSVGGIQFDAIPDLELALIQNQSWGKTGHKYQIEKAQYPGLAALLAV